MSANLRKLGIISSEATLNDPAKRPFSITWARNGQALEYGIRSEDGTAYFQEKQGGSSLLLIEEIPAGTYRLYVKNPETFNALSENESAESVNVTGALVYSRVPR